MARPTLADNSPDWLTPARRKELQDYQKRAAKRCGTCPKDAEGYGPELGYKFSFGENEDGSGGTTVRQCPVCKDIVVD
jgi:hypothetical protein